MDLLSWPRLGALCLPRLIVALPASQHIGQSESQTKHDEHTDEPGQDGGKRFAGHAWQHVVGDDLVEGLQGSINEALVLGDSLQSVRPW